MSFFKSAKGAFITMIAVMLISSSLAAVSSISKQAQTVSDEFYKGLYGDNMSIYEDLIDKTEYADSLVSMAVNKSYLAADESHITAIKQASTALKADGSAADLYQASSLLDDNVQWLIAYLQSAVSDTTDAANLRKYSSAYQSEIVTIASDPYNSLVKEFEDETSGLLGSLYRQLAKKVTYFR